MCSSDLPKPLRDEENNYNSSTIANKPKLILRKSSAASFSIFLQKQLEIPAISTAPPIRPIIAVSGLKLFTYIFSSAMPLATSIKVVIDASLRGDRLAMTSIYFRLPCVLACTGFL